MEKHNAGGPEYDPKLPDNEYVRKETGASRVPHETAKEPGLTSPTPEDVEDPTHTDEKSSKDDQIAKKTQAVIAPRGEELRPKDGTLDGGSAR